MREGRTAEVFGGLYGVQFDTELMLKHEITQEDPFHDAVGTMVNYDMSTYLTDSPTDMLCSALDLDERSVQLPQYQKVLRDKAPGKAIATELLADMLMHKNNKKNRQP